MAHGGVGGVGSRAPEQLMLGGEGAVRGGKGGEGRSDDGDVSHVAALLAPGVRRADVSREQAKKGRWKHVPHVSRASVAHAVEVIVKYPLFSFLLYTWWRPTH